MSTRLLPLVATLALTLATLLGSLALGVTGPPFVPVDPTIAVRADAAAAPEAGGVACVTGVAEDVDRADLFMLAAPGQREGSSPGEGEGRSTRGVLLTLGEQGPRRAVGPLPPGTLERFDVALGAAGWLYAGWADHPVTVWQEWRTDGSPGQPRGSVVSTCLPTDASVQTVMPLRTDGGNEALLRIANPFQADATFAVTFVTSDGIREPVALRNVSVPGGARIEIRLNDHVPEESDIATIVRVGAGRLAVEGLQRSVAAVGGVEGIAAVPPVTTSSVVWSFPWLPVGPEVESAVWLLNPGPRSVEVQVSVHTPQGATVPEEDVVEVGPGELVRIDAADLEVGGSRAFGVTLRSQTTGVIAAAGAAYLSQDDAMTGVVRYLAEAAPDPQWSVAGAAAPGRDSVLHVLNLAETEARPRITLTSLPEDDGPATITVLEPGALAPGAVARIVLPLDGARSWAAVIEGGTALVVSRTTLGRALLEPVAISATPSRTWRSPQRPLQGRPLDGWVGSLGTASGLQLDPRVTIRAGEQRDAEILSED